jgi:hypothetical protein
MGDIIVECIEKSNELLPRIFLDKRKIQ